MDGVCVDANVTYAHRVDDPDNYNWCIVPESAYDAVLFAGVALLVACVVSGRLSAVWVLVAGALCEVASFRANLGRFGNSVALWLGGIHPGEVFFYTFLPPLLLDSAARVDYFVFKKVLVLSLVFAFVLVCSSTLLAVPLMLWGLRLGPRYGWGWTDVALFNAMVASTDAVAVTSVLRAGGAPELLGALLEGESLFNDASGIVLFDIFLRKVLQTRRRAAESENALHASTAATSTATILDAITTTNTATTFARHHSSPHSYLPPLLPPSAPSSSSSHWWPPHWWPPSAHGAHLPPLPPWLATLLPELWTTCREFAWLVVGGLAVGMACGFAMKWALRLLQWRRLKPHVEVSLTFAASYLAFYVANAYLEASGVIAVVVFGVYGAATGTWGLSSQARRAGAFDRFWDVMAFCINGLVFFLLGASSVNYLIRLGVELDTTGTGSSPLLLETLAMLPLMYVTLFAMRGLLISAFCTVARAIATRRLRRLQQQQRQKQQQVDHHNQQHHQHPHDPNHQHQSQHLQSHGPSGQQQCGSASLPHPSKPSSHSLDPLHPHQHPQQHHAQSLHDQDQQHHNHHPPHHHHSHHSSHEEDRSAHAAAAALAATPDWRGMIFATVGGLRGAVSLIMAQIVLAAINASEEHPGVGGMMWRWGGEKGAGGAHSAAAQRDKEVTAQMVVFTSGFVLMSLVVNAPLLTPLMTLLRLNTTSSIKQQVRARAKAALRRFTAKTLGEMKAAAELADSGDGSGGGLDMSLMLLRGVDWAAVERLVDLSRKLQAVFPGAAGATSTATAATAAPPPALQNTRMTDQGLTAAGGEADAKRLASVRQAAGQRRRKMLPPAAAAADGSASAGLREPLLLPEDEPREAAAAATAATAEGQDEDGRGETWGSLRPPLRPQPAAACGRGLSVVRFEDDLAPTPLLPAGTAAAGEPVSAAAVVETCGVAQRVPSGTAAATPGAGRPHVAGGRLTSAFGLPGAADPTAAAIAAASAAPTAAGVTAAGSGVAPAASGRGGMKRSVSTVGSAVSASTPLTPGASGATRSVVSFTAGATGPSGSGTMPASAAAAAAAAAPGGNAVMELDGAALPASAQRPAARRTKTGLGLTPYDTQRSRLLDEQFAAMQLGADYGGMAECPFASYAARVAAGGSHDGPTPRDSYHRDSFQGGMPCADATSPHTSFVGYHPATGTATTAGGHPSLPLPVALTAQPSLTSAPSVTAAPPPPVGRSPRGARGPSSASPLGVSPLERYGGAGAGGSAGAGGPGRSPPCGALVQSPSADVGNTSVGPIAAAVAAGATPPAVAGTGVAAAGAANAGSARGAGGGDGDKDGLSRVVSEASFDGFGPVEGVAEEELDPTTNLEHDGGDIAADGERMYGNSDGESDGLLASGAEYGDLGSSYADCVSFAFAGHLGLAPGSFTNRTMLSPPPYAAAAAAFAELEAEAEAYRGAGAEGGVEGVEYKTYEGDGPVEGSARPEQPAGAHLETLREEEEEEEEDAAGAGAVPTGGQQLTHPRPPHPPPLRIQESGGSLYDTGLAAAATGGGVEVTSSAGASQMPRAGSAPAAPAGGEAASSAATAAAPRASPFSAVALLGDGDSGVVEACSDGTTPPATVAGSGGDGVCAAAVASTSSHTSGVPPAASPVSGAAAATCTRSADGGVGDRGVAAASAGASRRVLGSSGGGGGRSGGSSSRRLRQSQATRMSPSVAIGAGAGTSPDGRAGGLAGGLTRHLSLSRIARTAAAATAATHASASTSSSGAAPSPSPSPSPAAAPAASWSMARQTSSRWVPLHSADTSPHPRHHYSPHLRSHSQMQQQQQGQGQQGVHEQQHQQQQQLHRRGLLAAPGPAVTGPGPHGAGRGVGVVGGRQVAGGGGGAGGEAARNAPVLDRRSWATLQDLAGQHRTLEAFEEDHPAADGPGSCSSALGGGPAGHSRAAMQELLVEYRIRLLSGFKRFFHEQALEGVLSPGGMRLLCHCCDEALHHPWAPLDLWSTAEREVVGRGLVQWQAWAHLLLRRGMQRTLKWDSWVYLPAKWCVLPPLRWLAELLSSSLSRVMLVALEVAVELAAALSDSSPQLQWLRYAGPAGQSIWDEVGHQAEAVRRFILDRVIEAPDRFQATQSHRAALALLRQQVAFVRSMHKTGLVDGEEAEALAEPVERRIWRLEARGPRWQQPTLVQILASCAMLRGLPGAVLDWMRAEGDLWSFARGADLTPLMAHGGIFIVVLGTVRVTLLAAPDQLLPPSSAHHHHPHSHADGLGPASAASQHHPSHPHHHHHHHYHDPQFYVGVGGVVGISTALVGRSIPGMTIATAVAECNTLGKGPVVFALPPAAVQEVRERAAAREAPFQGLLLNMYRLVGGHLLERQRTPLVAHIAALLTGAVAHALRTGGRARAARLRRLLVQQPVAVERSHPTTTVAAPSLRRQQRAVLDEVYDAPAAGLLSSKPAAAAAAAAVAGGVRDSAHRRRLRRQSTARASCAGGSSDGGGAGEYDDVGVYDRDGGVGGGKDGEKKWDWEAEERELQTEEEDEEEDGDDDESWSESGHSRSTGRTGSGSIGTGHSSGYLGLEGSSLGGGGTGAAAAEAVAAALAADEQLSRRCLERAAEMVEAVRQGIKAASLLTLQPGQTIIQRSTVVLINGALMQHPPPAPPPVPGPVLPPHRLHRRQTAGEAPEPPLAAEEEPTERPHASCGKDGEGAAAAAATAATVAPGPLQPCSSTSSQLPLSRARSLVGQAQHPHPQHHHQHSQGQQQQHQAPQALQRRSSMQGACPHPGGAEVATSTAAPPTTTTTYSAHPTTAAGAAAGAAPGHLTPPPMPVFKPPTILLWLPHHCEPAVAKIFRQSESLRYTAGAHGATVLVCGGEGELSSGVVFK